MKEARRTNSRPVKPDAPTENTVDLHQLLTALQTVRDGNFTARLPGDWTGLPGKIADTFNEIVDANQRMAEELKRIGEAVGKRGKTRQRVEIKNRGGAHEDTIRELRIDSEGVRVGAPLTEFRGVMTGTPEYVGKDGPLMEDRRLDP